MKYFKVFIFIILIFITGCNINRNNTTPTPEPSIPAEKPDNSFSPAEAPWPSFGHDENHSNSTTNLGPTEGNLKWLFKTKGQIHSSPVIAPDGTIYTGSDDTYLYAINPDGTLKWKFKTGEKIRCTPLLIKNGNIYFLSGDGFFYSLNHDGKENWKFKTDEGKIVSKSSPCVNSDGTIYFLTKDKRSGYLYTLSPEGKKIRKTAVNSWTDTSPVIDCNGNVYISSKGIKAVSKEGEINYSFKKESETSELSIDRDGTIYFGTASERENVFMSIAGKEKKWAEKTDGYITGGSAIDMDGNIYTGSYDGKIYSFTNNGNINWTLKTEDIIRSSPVIDGEGNIYIGSYDGNFYSINREGKILWTFRCGAIESSCAIGSAETVYFTSLDGCIYAIYSGKGTKNVLPEEPAEEKYSGNIYGQNKSKNRQSSYRGPLAPKIKWKLPAGEICTTSPVIDNNGKIYFATEDKNETARIYRVNNHGGTEWVYEAGKTHVTAPIPDNNNTYIATWDERIIALNSKGKVKWQYKGDDSFKYPPLIKNNLIYSSCGNQVWCINKKGKAEWNILLDDLVSASPEEINGLIYQATGDGYIYIITSRGKIKNKIKTDMNIYNSTIFPEGQAIFGGEKGLYRLKGKSIKSFYLYPAGINMTIQPAVTDTGNLIVIYQSKKTGKSNVTCLNSEGQSIWEYEGGKIIKNPAVTDSSNNIYLTAEKGVIIVLNQYGREMYTYLSKGMIINPPAVSNDGSIFINYCILNNKNNIIESGIEKITGNGEKSDLFKFLETNENSYPIMSGKGNIHTISGNFLYIINKDGKIKSTFPINGKANYPPVSDMKGNLFVSIKNSIYSYNTEGKLLWSYKTEGKTGKDILTDKEKIYFYSDNRQVYSLNNRGVKQWVFSSSSTVYDLFIKDNIIYVNSEKTIYLLNSKGKVMEKIKKETNFFPYITKNSIITVNKNGTVKGLSKKGKKLWVFSAEDTINSGFDSINNNIYLTGKKGTVYSLNTDGKLNWTLKTDSPIDVPPLIDKRGSVYITTKNGSIYSVNPYGLKKWALKTKGLKTELNLSSDGSLYTVDNDGYIYSIGE